jgi:hypothetical protein
MIWTDPKLLFIHIPKTAGSSIEHYMHHCKGQLKTRDGRLGQHSTMQDAVRHFGDQILTDYDCFTVIRNTWERILGYYLMQYRRHSFSFATHTQLKPKQYVSFPEFYNTITPQDLHAEDIFHYLAVDGEIPECISFLDFPTVERDFITFWEYIGLEAHGPLPHVNKNTRVDQSLREYLLSDPDYIEIIGEKYRDEIEYFGFTPPKFNERQLEHNDAGELP